MSHLTPEQLTALRDGELRDPEALRHIKECPECRAQLADSRTIRALVQACEERPDERHPDERILADYARGVLSPRQTAKVERHLRACERCQSRLPAQKPAAMPLMAKRQAPSSAEITERVKRQFSSGHKRHSVGRADVHGTGWRLPPPPTEHKKFFMSRMACEQTSDMPPEMPRVRMVRKTEEPPAAKDAAHADMVRSSKPEPEPDVLRAEIRSGSVLEFGTDTILLRLSVRRTGSERTLLAEAFDRHTPRPVHNVEITLLPPQGPPLTRWTDSGGQCVFPLANGKSRLMVYTPQVWELILTAHPKK